MREGVFLGFDFGYKRIGVAVGQRLTASASPLITLEAKQGVPDWDSIQKLINDWRPAGLIVGLPTTLNDGKLYTTKASKTFASELRERFSLPVYLVDERLSTVEARAHLFAQGGYRKIKQAEIDSIAACIILEQWLQHPDVQNN
ncbi:Holliday junction resolvase RuvX [Legionella nagasakiensis]|uniref:Holliday junction resolvase RuvX n=1 Tax=Legionella nagasakiensis TaxID=535290 RepID=UPI0010547CC6|nr:Holliday junction resolvase RuvX [Legionella nagasakiensis]